MRTKIISCYPLLPAVPVYRQVEATDRQIDQLVYELYGLTDEEIRIVEEATK